MISRIRKPLGIQGVWRVAAMAFILTGGVWAQETPSAAPVTLGWDANTETDLAGYRVHYGLASGTPTTTVEAGNRTTLTLEGLSAGRTYYVVVTAYNTSGLESLPSDEISFSALSLNPDLSFRTLDAPPAGHPALSASTPTIGDWAPGSSGAFEFTITAFPGQRLDIYVSEDMLNWALLGATSNLTGRVRVVDHQAQSQGTRYYQVKPGTSP